jgi:hypothetical protein
VGLALDRHHTGGEYRKRVKQGAMILAAVETVTKANPVWRALRHNPDIAA